MSNMDENEIDLGDLPGADFMALYDEHRPSFSKSDCDEFTRRMKIRSSDPSRSSRSSRKIKSDRNKSGDRYERQDQSNEHVEHQNPHAPFMASIVTLDVNVSMTYNPNTSNMQAKISTANVENFMALSSNTLSKDLSKSIISRVRLNSVVGLSDKRWHLSVLDGANAKKKSLLGQKKGYWKDGQFSPIGFPISNTVDNAPTTIFECDGALDDDISKYGKFSMEMLLDGVFPFPDKKIPHMMIPIYPNGRYFFYALVTRGNVMHNLNEMFGNKMNENEDYIKLPIKEYNMVVKAYEKKVKEIEAKMHNLSSIEITLAPMTEEAIGETKEAFVSLTIEAFMPEKS